MTVSTSSDLTEILGDLIKFSTVSNNLTELNACFDYIENFLNNFDIHINRYDCRGRPSLLATTKKTNKPKILLQAHLDVVPADKKQFSLIEKTTRFYGRGVFDMKFAAAIYLKLISELATKLKELDFGIMFTSDEEVGGINGVGYLLNEEDYSADVCLLPDGGNSWEIQTTSNDLWMIKLTATGKTAHGSRPWEGDNAIDTLIKALVDIKSLFGESKAFTNSITVSQISGGKVINQVPGKAEATIDMRLVNRKEIKPLKEKINLITKLYKIELETLAYEQGVATDLNNPEIKKFINLAEKIYGKAISKTHSFGSSDAHFFADKNIPVIIIRPAGGGAHSDNEWLNKEQFFSFYELIRDYVLTSKQ